MRNFRLRSTILAIILLGLTLLSYADTPCRQCEEIPKIILPSRSCFPASTLKENAFKDLSFSLEKGSRFGYTFI